MSNNTENNEPREPEVETTEEQENLQEEQASTEEESSDSKDAEEEESTESSEDGETVSKAEFDKINDKYLRLYAEFDNYRRRTAKESLTLVATANADLITKQCDILDNFDRAFIEENKAPDLETFEQGMKMIHDQFVKVLEEAGLDTIDPLEQEFNPEEHEALMQQPSDLEEGNIVTVFQKGYKLNEKVIRHAKVIVSSGPAEA
jgi:molecular chaperone GrpE